MMNQENLVTIDTGEVKLKALLHDSKEKRGVVIAHPHPSFGGSMYNNVVNSICSAFSSVGYSTLRFNFRGVGESTGEFDNGIGEVEDYIAAYNYLKHTIGISQGIIIAGYSFGALVVFNALKNFQKEHKVFLISPPVEEMEFRATKNEESVIKHHTIHIFTGDSDEFCPLQSAQHFANRFNADLNIIKNTGHFYREREEFLIEAVSRCFHT